MSNGLKVKKRSGHVEQIDLDKMHLMVDEACKGLAGVSASQVEIQSGIGWVMRKSCDQDSLSAELVCIIIELDLFLLLLKIIGRIANQITRRKTPRSGLNTVTGWRVASWGLVWQRLASRLRCNIH